MRIRVTSLLILSLFFGNLFSQEKLDFGQQNSHEYYIGQLDNAKDASFHQILEQYDRFIAKHPYTITARIERCKFIGNAYLDEYEEYNLKYEETEACIEALYEQYPTVPKVLLYRAENLYGDEQLAVLETAFGFMTRNLSTWSDADKASLNEMFGNYYRYQENSGPALKYFLAAQNYNSSLDLSIPIAQLYLDRNQSEDAKDILLEKIASDTTAWGLNSKAKLLLEVGETDRALELFNKVEEKDSSYVDNSEMAKAMVNLEQFDVAREFLVKDTVNAWNMQPKAKALLIHDLEYSSAKQALTTLRNLQENDYGSDILAVKRLRIFFKNPFLGWNFSEIGHLLLLLLSLLIIAAIPYLWVLPIYNLGLLLKRRLKNRVPKLDFSWGLKHFWLISIVYLLAQYILNLIFYYDESIEIFFTDSAVYVEEVLSQTVLANSALVFAIFMMLGTLLFVRKRNVRHIYESKFTIGKSLVLGFAFVIFNVFFLNLLKRLVGYEDIDLSQWTFDASAEIFALLKTHGFLAAALVVAVLAPIYEEIIFRGIILGSVEKHLGFIPANCIQAVLFAFIHHNFKIFLYYFVFAIVTGYLTKKSGGLLTGIILHALNNIFVLILIRFIWSTFSVTS